MKIEYTTLELSQIEITETKPILFEKDKGYPFHLLTPREFEYITYFSIKQYIENENLWNNFDGIKLLGGVKDLGRDCSLQVDGNNFGLIQCKQSENNTKISKTNLSKEIIKFLLYSIVNSTLIYDIKQFSYYFFSSSGLSIEAKKLIEDFNVNILKEKSLKNWVNQVIKQHKTVKDLIDFDNVKDDLECKLKKVRVEELKIEDFNLVLSKEYNKNIISRFFSVKSVIETDKAIQAIEETIKEELGTNLNNEKTISLLNAVSSVFDNIKNYFGDKKQTHIDRKETSLLYDWVLSNLSGNKNNIAILEANASSKPPK